MAEMLPRGLVGVGPWLRAARGSPVARRRLGCRGSGGSSASVALVAFWGRGVRFGGAGGLPCLHFFRFASLSWRCVLEGRMGVQAKAIPACGSMTTTPSGAAYLVEGVIHSSFLSSSPVSFVGENLDLMVRQWWRQWRHFLVGGFTVSALPALEPWGAYPIHLVLASRVGTIVGPSDPSFASPSSPSLLVAQVASVWRMLCRLAG